MLAVTRNQYGGHEVLKLKNLPNPTPKEDELLVKVHATTVNRTDCGILTGKPFLIRFFTGLFKPASNIPGTDFAGEVVAVGDKVSQFKVGDHVWGLNDEGLRSQASMMTIKEKGAVLKIPPNFSFKDAVACAEGAHYAINFLNKVSLKEGDHVLVNGATGAIGSAALQILKAKGVWVTAIGNTKNIGLLKDLGADKVLNYEEEDFTKVETEKYPFIFDAVGKSSFGACKPLLEEKGVYISSELGPGAENLYLPLTTKIKGGKRVIFPFPSNCKRSLKIMNQLMESGQFKPVIDRTYQPQEIQEAYQYVMSAQKTGNVIIDFSEVEEAG